MEEEEDEEDEVLLSFIISLFLICSMGVSSVIMDTNWRPKTDRLISDLIKNSAVSTTLPLSVSCGA